MIVPGRLLVRLLRQFVILGTTSDFTGDRTHRPLTVSRLDDLGNVFAEQYHDAAIRSP